jgi:spore coat protein CotH
MCISAAILGAGALGAGASIFGASQAADAQTEAADAAIKAQMDMFKMTQGNLKPWLKGGQKAWETFNKKLSELQKPFNWSDLENSPGYKFTLDQGLKGVQSGFAAKGLGTSGAAMKGAADYTTGLASNTYTQRLQEHLGQNQQRYNMLLTPAQMGMQAAMGQGQLGQQTGASVGNALIGAGNAQAGMWGTIGSALSGLAGTIPTSMMMPRMFDAQMNYLNGRGTAAAA